MCVLRRHGWGAGMPRHLVVSRVLLQHQARIGIAIFAVPRAQHMDGRPAGVAAEDVDVYGYDETGQSTGDDPYASVVSKAEATAIAVITDLVDMSMHEYEPVCGAVADNWRHTSPSATPRYSYCVVRKKAQSTVQGLLSLAPWITRPMVIQLLRILDVGYAKATGTEIAHPRITGAIHLVNTRVALRVVVTNWHVGRQFCDVICRSSDLIAALPADRKVQRWLH